MTCTHVNSTLLYCSFLNMSQDLQTNSRYLQFFCWFFPYLFTPIFANSSHFLFCRFLNWLYSFLHYWARTTISGIPYCSLDKEPVSCVPALQDLMISSRGRLVAFQGRHLGRERGTADVCEPMYSLLKPTSRIVFQQLIFWE